jgi:ATP-grasp domain
VSAPTFVFAEHSRQGTFAQLASVLRRHGFRTIHVSTARPLWINRLISRLIYHRSIFVTADEFGGLCAMLAGEDVYDIQHTEYVLEFLARGDAVKLPNGVGERLSQRADLLDKFALGELCRREGVPVPEKLAAQEVSAEQAIAAFGLPLVVKAKVGAYGRGVRVAHTREAVEAALRDLGTAESVFFERFIEGDYLDYSAVAGADGPVQEVVTRTVAAVGTAPPSAIETVDDPALLAIGRHAVQALNLTGFIHIDAVRDAQGRYWLMDVNLRTWGSMVSLRRAGIDFAEGYLSSLGLRDQAPTRAIGIPAVTLTTFSGVVDEQAARGSFAGTISAYARNAGPYIRQLGLRYGVAQLLASLGAAATNRIAAKAGHDTRRERRAGDGKCGGGRATTGPHSATQDTPGRDHHRDLRCASGGWCHLFRLLPTRRRPGAGALRPGRRVP